MTRPTHTLLQLTARVRRWCASQERELQAELKLRAAELACLQAMPWRDPIAVGTLAQRVGLSPSRGGRVVETLVRDGVLAREVSESDRRVQELHLTDRGRAAKQRVVAHQERCEQTLREGLSGDDLEIAIDGLQRLVGAIEKEERT